MASGLQSKVQLLAILLVLFTLLSVPLFFQVRADASEDKSQAKSTLLSKMFGDMAKKLKDNPRENVEVEDAWAKYLKDQGQNCGPECDPNSDLDGDGISNREEINRGRNPACNEEAEGFEYCAGQPTTPQNETRTIPALDRILYANTAISPGFSDSFTVPFVSPYFHRWNLTWGVGGYSGLGKYMFIIEDGANNVVCCHQSTVDVPVGGGDEDRQTLEGSDLPAAGQYRIRLQTNQPAPQDVERGTWHIEIHGLRDASTTA